MPSCPQCQGRGFVAFDLPQKHPRFGEIVPCSACFPNFYEHPNTPVLPETLGECELHHMRWRRFANGGIGHTLTVVDRHEAGASPLWCIKGHEMTQLEFNRWFALHGTEVIVGEGYHKQLGESWCYAHQTWESDQDPYDFPVSASFLAWAGAMGFCPPYPDGRRFPPPELKDENYNSESWWRQELASSPGWWHEARAPEGTMVERDKGIKEAKTQKRQSVPKKPPASGIHEALKHA